MEEDRATNRKAGSSYRHEKDWIWEKFYLFYQLLFDLKTQSRIFKKNILLLERSLKNNNSIDRKESE